MDAFDPGMVQDLGDPAQWGMMTGLGPEVGSLMLYAPEKAAQVMASAGIMPPGYGGRTGGASIPMQAPGAPKVDTFNDRFAGDATPPVPMPKGQAQVPQVPQAGGKGRDLYPYPIGPDLDPMTVGGPAPDTGSGPMGFDPLPAKTPPAVPSSGAGTFGPRSPSSTGSMLEALKAIAPPAVHYQPSSAPPHPAVAGPEGVKNQVNTGDMVRLFQQLAQPGSAPLLSTLLGRHL
jgi:hypothetical protein